jgi:hypothetical protein
LFAPDKYCHKRKIAFQIWKAIAPPNLNCVYRVTVTLGSMASPFDQSNARTTGLTIAQIEKKLQTQAHEL